MSDSNKHKKHSSGDLIRYRSGKMSEKQMNSFERELQKDPFAEEAMEGLEAIPVGDLSSDIKKLQKHLMSRTKSGKGFVYYRIAASIALLMVISTVTIIMNRNKTSDQFAQMKSQSEMFEITGKQPIKSPVAVNEPMKEVTTKDLQKRIKTNAKQILKVPEEVTEKTDDIMVTEAAKMDKASDKKINAAEGNATGAMVSAPLAALAVEKTSLRSEPKAASAKADSHLLITSDTSEFALNEVTVIGYGVVNAVSGKKKALSGYTPPQPVDGNTVYEKYIRENIHRPDSSAAGQRVVVVMSFQVQKDGTIDRIKILRSPHQSFSNEAIRLVRMGPAWNPAEDNGVIIEDEVRIRIVFN